MLSVYTCCVPVKFRITDKTLFRIARIIGGISRHVYSVNDIPKEDRLGAANGLVQELHEWHSSLPSHLGTVQPSTLIPSFRRQAIALKMAYLHAIIHAKRPFLLGDGYTKDVSECIEASKASLKLVDKMARDSELFHSFWWTHYVVFCALAVVYVWEIQQARHQLTQDDSGSRHELFDLAERCRSHLQRATTGLSPSRRYNIILEELRLEAQGCRLSRDVTRDMQQEILSPIANGTTGPGLGSQDGSMLNMTDTFLFTDWLALDSSASDLHFFDCYEANCVRPRRHYFHCPIQIPFLRHGFRRRFEIRSGLNKETVVRIHIHFPKRGFSDFAEVLRAC